MKTKITLILLLSLLSLEGGKVFAQLQLNTIPTSYQPSVLVQGEGEGTYKIDITNNNSSAIAGATLTLTLPAGMEYVSGSITLAEESNVSNLQKPVFALNSVPAGNTITPTFRLRINCGFAGGTIGYATAGTNAAASATSPVAGNTPAPAFAFSAVPSPQALTLQLKTDGTRTIKFKNSGSVPVKAVYIESTVNTAAQSSSYKIANVNNGTLSNVANGFRIALSGTSLQNAITASIGNADASFDGGEEITVVITEQILSCATGITIPLTFKVGTADTKDSFCYFDTAASSIVTPAGNQAISLKRLTGTTLPTFCENGKVSYIIKNEGSGAASSIFNIKLPWSTVNVSSGNAPDAEPAGNFTINKISLNGTDITGFVLKRNGSGASALIPGQQNCFVIDLAGLASAYGSALQNLDGDGKFDDLAAGQSINLDFEYGFNPVSYKTCSLNSSVLPNVISNYFALGTSYINQCGARSTKTNYPSGVYTNYIATSFAVGAQQYKAFTATLSAVALKVGDKTKLTSSFGGNLSGAFVQGGAKIIKTFTFILPDGLDYDPSGTARLMYNATGIDIPSSAISYNAASKTLTISPLATLTGLNFPNDNFEIPLVVSSSGNIVNKTLQYSATIGFVGCNAIVPYGCNASELNYAVIDTTCGKVATTSFDMTRATFGYVPAPTNTNIGYTPTAFVNENTEGINLHGAVSKDRVKTSFKGVVNSTNFTELWARVKYASNAGTNSSNFDKISSNESDSAGTITIVKASDGSLVVGNITVGDIVFVTDADNNLQLQQVNLGAIIGSGKSINYALQPGDQIAIDWFTKVSRDNLSYIYSALQNLEGDLYTKDSGGTVSDCQPIPLNFFIQRLYLTKNSYSNIQTVVGRNSMRIQASITNGSTSTDAFGDHFPKEVRNYGVFRNVKWTVPGIWVMDTSAGKEPFLLNSGIVSNYKLDPAIFIFNYSGGNTIITCNNSALGSDGLPLPNANIPILSDWYGSGGYFGIFLNLLPVCATPGLIYVPTVQNFDTYTTAADNTNTESYVQDSFVQGTAVTYYNYSANAAPTLQNVDGIASTVNWQVTIANTSDTATIVAAGGTPSLPNNWISFVSPNNNITVTRLIDTETNTVYPVESYGIGKYWAKLGDIASTATFNVEATYNTCSNEQLDVRYGFGAIGYPTDPDQGYAGGVGKCASTEKNFELNLLPKDMGLTMDILSPSNPVQFCDNDISVSGENLIDYSMKIANTGVGNAENLILEANFPQDYLARSGTSKLTYDGATKTIGDPVFNVAKGVWQWNISADANGLAFLPGASNGINEMILSYQGETSCGFVSGSNASYNIMASSGCGELKQYSASGNGMELSMVPSLLNSYVLSPTVIELKNDGSGTPYKVEIKNQGANPVSSGERIYVILPSSIDYVENSIVHIEGAANVTAPQTNAIVGNSRILTFPLPFGADGINLNQNETASFSIDFKIINPEALNCGTIANAIKLESIYSLSDVECGAVKCPVNFITGKSSSDVLITKTELGITPGVSTATFASSANNDVTVKYTIENTGTIANSTPIIVEFFIDLDNNGLYREAEPILYTQTISGSDSNIASGSTSGEFTTAVFSVPESGICGITAAIRAANNAQICQDYLISIPIKYTPAQTAFSICGRSDAVIGNEPNGSIVSWSPADYLSAADISNPIFNYTGTPVMEATDFVYTATVAHSGGCTDTFSTTVTVTPDPVIKITDPAAVCSGTAVDLTDPSITSGSAVGLTYTYFKDIDASISLIDPQAVINEGTYYIKATNVNGCFSIAPVTVIINPLPNAYMDGAITVCKNDESPNVTFTGSGGSAPYTFTYSVNGGIPLNVTTSGDNSATLAVPTNTVGDITYSLLNVRDINGCEKVQTGSIKIIIKPLPTATVEGSAEVCIGSVMPEVIFTGIGGTAPYTFTYKINDEDEKTVTTSTGSSATVSVPTDSTGNFVYTLISVSSSEGCVQTQNGTAAIIVKDLPTALISGASEACKNAPYPFVSFTGSNGTEPYTFKYTINGGAEYSITTVGGSSATVSVPTNESGDYEYSLVSVSDNFSCENLQSGSVIVRVNEQPTATISVTDDADQVCQNETSSVTFTGAGGISPYTFRYTINGGAEQSISSLAGSTAKVSVPTGTTGSFIYTLVSVEEDRVDGCQQLQSGTATVTVNDLPVLTITNPEAVCSGTAVDLTAATVTNGSTSGLTFAYFTDEMGINLLANANAVTAEGLYYIQGTTAAGCASAIQPVAVTVNPIPTLVTVDPSSVCSGTAVDLTADSVTAGSSADLIFTYFTDASATTALANPSAVSEGGTYYIKGTTIEGCSAIAPVRVTVNATPNLAITDPSAICSGDSVDLTAASVTAGSTPGLSLAYFTDAAASLPLTSPWDVTAGGTYYIRGTTSDGCSAVEAVAVTVNPTPSLTIADPPAVCSGASIDLSSAVSGASAYIYYEADQTTVLTSAVISPATTTYYYVKGISIEGCETLKQKIKVTVNPLPSEPVISVAGTGSVCSGGNAIITAIGTGSFQWYKDGVPIAGATNSSYEITGASSSDAGIYSAEVSNGICTSLQSNAIILTIENCQAAFTLVKIVSDANGDRKAQPEEELTYSLTVKNTGSLKINNIIVKDDIPQHTTYISGGILTGNTVNFNVSDLSAGLSMTFSFKVKVASDLSNITSISNLAAASADNGPDIPSKPADPYNPENPDPSCTNPLGCPTDLPADGNSVISLEKHGTLVDSNGDGKINVGDIISYAFTVKNNGSSTISNIMVTDINASLTGGPLASLASGQEDGTTFKGIHSITQADIDKRAVYNLAKAEGKDPAGNDVTAISSDPRPCTACPVDPMCPDCTITPIAGEPGIAVIKKASLGDENGNGFAEEGETIRYNFEIKNTGNITLTYVSISDNLPGLVLSGSPITLAPQEINTVGFSAVYTITQADFKAGSVTNQALAEGTAPWGEKVNALSGDENFIEEGPTVIDIKTCIITVFNAVSPNGDGINDELQIQGLECYSDNTVEIYNRWGIKVFEASGYAVNGNIFRGYSEGKSTISKGECLPDGTYFYLLKYQDKVTKTAFDKTGYLYIEK